MYPSLQKLLLGNLEPPELRVASSPPKAEDNRGATGGGRADHLRHNNPSRNNIQILFHELLQALSSSLSHQLSGNFRQLLSQSLTMSWQGAFIIQSYVARQ